MRAVIAALILALSSVLVGSTPALADVPLHLHCLATPGTTATLAGGLTANGPQAAFENFHFLVHMGALQNPTNPVSVTGSFTGSC